MAYREAERTVDEDVRRVVSAWASAQFGAPKDFDAFITGVESRDLTILRIATQLENRRVVEGRSMTNLTTHRGGRQTLSAIDPWNVDPESLPRETEHLESCSTCAGRRTSGCGNCGATGQARCGSCGGSGRIWRQYKNHGKYIQCTACRTKGTVRCISCGGSGAVACPGCGGNGVQLVWFNVQRTPRIVLEVLGDAAAIAAHPRLSEHRFLEANELREFQVRTAASAAGAVEPTATSSEIASILRERASKIDTRQDRIVHQQVIELAVVRRDVSYDLCGRTSTIVVSGPPLSVAPTASAIGAIRTRVRTAVGLAAAVCVGVVALGNTFRGSTEYSDHLNSWLSALTALGCLGAVASATSATRLLRPGFQFRSAKAVDAVGAGALVLALVALPIAYLVGRPTIAEARKAIAGHDISRARLVLGALEKDAPSATLPDVKDEIELASIDSFDVDTKLGKLDAIVARKGVHAPEAAKKARDIRLAAATKLVDDGKGAKALATLDSWSASTEHDADFQELRARAWDISYAACADDLCRWKAADAAQAVAPSKTRGDRAVASRKALVEALSFTDRPNEPTLDRLKRLRALGVLAAKTTAATTDVEMDAAAKGASTLASTEREKVAALGADGAVVAELYGAADGTASKIGHADAGGVAIAWVLNDAGRCTGVYLVGQAKEKRVLNDKAHSAAAATALSQAVGTRVALPAAPTTTATTTYFSAGSVSAVARWRGSDLMELRIGDALP